MRKKIKRKTYKLRRMEIFFIIFVEKKETMKQDKTKSKNANPQNEFPQNISAAQ